MSCRGGKTAEGTPYLKVNAVAIDLAELTNKARYIWSLRNSSSEANFIENLTCRNSCRIEVSASDCFVVDGCAEASQSKFVPRWKCLWQMHLTPRDRAVRTEEARIYCSQSSCYWHDDDQCHFSSLVDCG